jgi:hypothetical protein
MTTRPYPNYGHPTMTTCLYPNYGRPTMTNFRAQSLSVNISGPSDPIREISFRIYSLDLGLPKESKIMRIQSVDPEI